MDKNVLKEVLKIMVNNKDLVKRFSNEISDKNFLQQNNESFAYSNFEKNRKTTLTVLKDLTEKMKKNK